ncbi:MAG: hypothetical protein KC635_24860, partial [Myxococcales bacterium]|nr:hypothetical protein [Myxococcales bacterium]
MRHSLLAVSCLAALVAPVDAVAAAPSLAPAVETTDLGGVLVVPISGADRGPAAWLGGATPADFGRGDGRLRVLAVADDVGAVVVAVEGPRDGALYTLSTDAASPPRRLCDAARVGFDVALSPDGRRLVFSDARGLRVASLAPGAPAPCVTLASAVTPDDRFERPRWASATQVAWERARVVGGRVEAYVEIADAAGKAPPRYALGPGRRGQDRAQAFLADGRVLVATARGLELGDATGLATLAPGFSGQVIAPWRGGALLTLGEGGVARTAALATLDDHGVLRRVTKPLAAWLDPVATPDGASAWWATRDGDGYRLMSYPLAPAGAPIALTPTHPEPVQLLAWAPSGAVAAGCRGDDVVIVRPAGGVEVLASLGGAPSCGVVGVTDDGDGRAAVLFHAKDGDELVPRWVDVASGDVGELPRGTTLVAASGGAAVLVATARAGRLIGLSRDNRVVGLTPWAPGGVADAWVSETRDRVAWRDVGSAEIRAIAVAPGAEARVVASLDATDVVLGRLAS